MTDRLTYHDLHITTADLPRTSIFNLPYDVEVTCTRIGGWQVWRRFPETDIAAQPALVAGEYAGPESWLVLDVAGHVIVDSRDPDRPEG